MLIDDYAKSAMEALIVKGKYDHVKDVARAAFEQAKAMMDCRREYTEDTLFVTEMSNHQYQYSYDNMSK